MMTVSELQDRIQSLPREQLAFLPTPLQFLPRLSRALGGPRILIKRDDLTGLLALNSEEHNSRYG